MQVANVISKPENDDLSLVEASRCAHRGAGSSGMAAVDLHMRILRRLQVRAAVAQLTVLAHAFL